MRHRVDLDEPITSSLARNLVGIYVLTYGLRVALNSLECADLSALSRLGNIATQQEMSQLY
jgi:hypothetical protein